MLAKTGWAAHRDDQTIDLAAPTLKGKGIESIPHIGGVLRERSRDEPSSYATRTRSTHKARPRGSTTSSMYVLTFVLLTWVQAKSVHAQHVEAYGMIFPSSPRTSFGTLVRKSQAWQLEGSARNFLNDYCQPVSLGDMCNPYLPTWRIRDHS
ncbi:hypothetical protein PAXRUDRAFT_832168 [Paxillus rubicundulus Ve08.2h10]|uniref:Uncharacterized protein n=1 Tax=Paxillus rubicundulus Ve08.2h10 TaxID=930991 RepID=A0A0D0DLC0_9AGAM|nr:hypothetical protein PAXRUDRAFT_832168 [Paxillus rubicundulus Ve08.2h10]